MDRINYTSSGYTPVQVGRVVPRDGIQADIIDGDLTIRW